MKMKTDLQNNLIYKTDKIYVRKQKKTSGVYETTEWCNIQVIKIPK